MNRALRTPSRHSSTAWVVALLTIVLLINYVDRGNLATAAASIQDDLHLSKGQLGFLLSAFYFSYVVAMAPVGWLAERYGAHLVLAAGAAIWAVATFLTGFAVGFTSLLLLRLLLGLGESAAFPCSSKLIAVTVKPAGIGTANGFTGFGYLAGPAVGTYIGGMLTGSVGWRPVFIIFGALSALWLWPWSRVRIAPAAVQAGQPTIAAPPLSDILRQRGLWGASLGHFASNYNFYFILSWLPYYLVKARGFSMQSMAGVLGIAYLVNAFAALAGGWCADRWVSSGRSASTIYKATMGISHLASIALMAGVALLSVHAMVVCLFVYEILLGFASPGVFAIPQIMAGPTATGRWVGVQNTCGNLAGILAPAITGVIADATGSFTAAFGLAVLVNVLGLAGWIFILPQVAPLNWQQSGAPAHVAHDSG